MLDITVIFYHNKMYFFHFYLMKVQYDCCMREKYVFSIPTLIGVFKYFWKSWDWDHSLIMMVFFLYALDELHPFGRAAYTVVSKSRLNYRTD